MRAGKFIADLVNHTVGQKGDKPPYVLLDFRFEDEGIMQSISYIGSLSEKAEPFTLEQLKSIGYKGRLQTYRELQDFSHGVAEIEREGITLAIKEEEYKGKKRFKVHWFSKMSDEQKDEMARKVFEYRNKREAPKEAPKKEAKKDLVDSFDPDENIGTETMPF